MTELQRYLAEEVAEDHVDGILTRREAMRRLGMLGLTVPAAAALLAGFADTATAGTATAPTAGGGAAGAETAGRDGHRSRGPHVVDWAPVATEEVTFAGPAGTLMGTWAPAAQPRGGLLVIHENRGLNDHIRSVVGRFAATGYSSLALDLLSRDGGTGAFPDEAAVSARLAQIPPEQFDADMSASVTEIQRRLRHKRIAAIGFCFGGAMVWRLLAAGERRLAAAAPFYGPFPTDGDLRGARAAVLGVYGGLDTRVNATRPAAEAALHAARLEHQILTFTAADHAFFNDTGTRYNPAAAAEAYRRVLSWFEEHVADRDHDRD